MRKSNIIKVLVTICISSIFSGCFTSTGKSEWIADQYHILINVEDRISYTVVEKITGFNEKVHFIEVYSSHPTNSTNLKNTVPIFSSILIKNIEWEENGTNYQTVRSIDNTYIDFRKSEILVTYDDGVTELISFNNELEILNYESIFSNLNAIDADSFTEDNIFYYLGSLEANQIFHVYLTELIWGESQRSTKRILIFDEDLHYIGQFSHFNDFPEKIEDSTIIFSSVVEENGNIISFENGIPSQTLIDGDIISFYY